jgi:ABC-2 type transport system permease protein
MNRRALSLAFRMGVRQAVGQPLAVIGQLVILVVLLLSYGAIAKAISVGDLDRLHLNAAYMIWYIAMTETVMMLGLWHCRDFQQDIASGLMDVWLLRPTSFWMLKLAEWMGEEIIRFLPTLLVAVLLARMISGIWLEANPVFVLIVPAMLCAMTLLLCSAILLGLATIWIGNTTAGLWIYFKCIFIFGALLWPMVFYPVWLRQVAMLSPFPSILAHVGELVLPITDQAIVLHALQQFFWICVLLIACNFVAQAARRRLAR